MNRIEGQGGFLEETVVGLRLVGGALGRNGDRVDLEQYYGPYKPELVQANGLFEKELTRQYLNLNSGDSAEIVKVFGLHQIFNLVKFLAQAKAEAGAKHRTDEVGSCFLGRDSVVFVSGQENDPSVNNLLLMKPQNLSTAERMIHIALKAGGVTIVSGLAVAARTCFHQNLIVRRSDVEIVQIDLKDQKPKDIQAYLRANQAQVCRVCGAIDYAEQDCPFRENILTKTQINILRGLPSPEKVKKLRSEIAAIQSRFNRTRPVDI